MSRFAVTAEQITVHPHPDADRLELAQVAGYRAVVAKGAFRDGDWVVYIPEAAVLPDTLIDELGLTGRLAGGRRNRVKAVRLRGQLSQGIVCRPARLAGVDLQAAAADGTDFADVLGIVKHVPPIPTQMSGKVVPAPALLPMFDVENHQRFPTAITPGERVVASEKLHGSACAVTWDAADGRLWVSSKGLSRQGLALVESPANVYWQAVRAHQLEQLAAALAAELGADRVGLFGEVYGAGIQDLHYGIDRTARGFALFDVAVASGAGPARFVDAVDLAELVAGRVPTVPVLHDGPFDPDLLHALASGTETVSGTGAHLREGLVVRTARERFSDVLGGRAMLKMVSGDYLTRHGGTEYE